MLGYPSLSFTATTTRVVLYGFGGSFVLCHCLAELASAFGQEQYTPLHGCGKLSPSEAAHDSLYAQNVGGRKRKSPVSDREFYSEYHGHKVRDLQWVHSVLRRECGRFVFLCGDSSLDNKHWFFTKEPGQQIPKREMSDDAITAPAINGYETCLTDRDETREPRMAMDVSYWFNRLAAEDLGPLECCTIIASVEASTAADRHHFGLLAQDQFIRDSVSEDDFIVMSVGGNDVALAPTWATAVNIALYNLSPQWLVFLGLAPGHRHFLNWFHKVIYSYIRQLVARKRPVKVVVNMIYYPDEAIDEQAWPGATLKILGYDANPGRLQLVLRTLHRSLAAKAPPRDLAGLDVEVFPLFTVLDGADTGDYKQRVEPSVQGGEKIARALLGRLPQ
ncbi:hypothetical protein TrST_g2702 [Triparma strigata]|uniref:Uncharacterized protein n=1 Tax=Triparma strigata TaxID=1606541 RepID=A0A9W7BX88_9STRA|nr:hypothetical protein TrST_g2702 [Triparma strigata]